MARKYLKIIFWTGFYLLIALILIKNSFSYLDPDLGWHLMVGNEIINSAEVPSVNYYNYTIKGANWVDHEWLTNLLMSFLYNKFGYLFLTAVFAFIVLAALYLQNRFINRFISQKKDSYAIAVLQLLGVYAMRPHLGIRVQELSILMLILLFYVLFDYEKERKPKYLPWLIPLFFVWSNLHGSFLIGFFVLGVWIATLLLHTAYKYYKQKIKPDHRAYSLPAIFAVLSFLSTWFTPYGTRLYSFLFDYRDSYYLSHIEEWLPIFFVPINYWGVVFLGLTGGLLLLVMMDKHGLIDLGTSEERKICLRRLPNWYFIITAFFFFMSIVSKRHFPLFYVVSVPLIYAMAYYLIELPRDLGFKRIKYAAKISLAIAFVLAVVWLAKGLNTVKNPFSSFCSEYPCQAVDFLKDHPRYADLRIYNLYGWGGFLIKTWPGKELFIDGRLPQYPYQGHTMLAEYYDFMNEDMTAIKLDEHGVELVLIPPYERPIRLNWFERIVLGLDQDKLSEDKNPLRIYLSSSQEWTTVYKDNTSVIYVRSNLIEE